jgi:hypothetical protein
MTLQPYTSLSNVENRQSYSRKPRRGNLCSHSPHCYCDERLDRLVKFYTTVFGFQVDDVDALRPISEQMGATSRIDQRPEKQRGRVSSLRSRLQSRRSFETRLADLKAVETKLFKSFDGSNIDLGSRAVTGLAPLSEETYDSQRLWRHRCLGQEGGVKKTLRHCGACGSSSGTSKFWQCSFLLLRVLCHCWKIFQDDHDISARLVSKTESGYAIIPHCGLRIAHRRTVFFGRFLD